MRLLRPAAVFVMFSALTLGSLTGQDKGSPAKGRQLPAYWTKLGLTDSQKTKVHDIQAKYQGKIEDHQKQIADLRDKMRKEEESVLTPEQKTRLREILASKGPSDKEESKDK